MPPEATEKTFTTGEVARICGVTKQAVIKWFDDGKLNGFRVPYSRSRRIPYKDLVSFMARNAIPLDRIEGPQKIRILAVDDHPETLRFYKRAYGRKPGFELRTAASGFEAGLVTASFRPHIIILDILLPDIDGREVAEVIRKTPELADTRIIAISALTATHDVEEIYRAGIDDYLAKPFSLKDLEERVEKYLTKAAHA